MKNTLFALIILFASSFFFSCGPTAQLTAEQSIDKMFSEYAAPNAPGASVLVLSKDSIVFKRGYGLASIAGNTKVTPSTNFRLASITKQFTAMSILMLYEQGRLSLEDKILKFFPDFPLYGKDITVRHLLNHTSGLVDYESLIPDTQTVQVSDEDCLRLMHQVDSLYFPAGNQYQYSNTGYALLALIVERSSGMRFAEFLRTQIFDKLGMTTTVAFENGISMVMNRAYGHSYINNHWVETDQSNTSAVLGDGGIYSNTEEMARWISSLWHYRLIKESTQQMAWSDAQLNDGTSINYGMGWHKEIYKEIRHPHHGGSTIGFRNHILVFPEQKLLVIILTNRNQGNPIATAQAIADLFLPE